MAQIPKMSNPDKPWDYQMLSMNSNITMDIVNANPDKPWDYSHLSCNPNISMVIVNANPDIPWDYLALSSHKNIAMDIIEANYENLSLNLNLMIKMEFVNSNPDKPWSWYCLSRNPKITIESVKANRDKPWDYWAFSHNPNITIEFIKANPDKPWDYSALSHNPNITIEFINANLDKPWYWKVLSSSPNITEDIVKDITTEFVEANPDKPWSYRYLTSQIQLQHPIEQEAGNTSTQLEIDLSLLSEKEKKPNFIRILQVLSTTANHRGRAKDLQNRYDNLPSNTNKVIIPITVKAWNKILETNKEGILHDESDFSCMFEGYHRICKGKNSPRGKSVDYWVNTTLFPIYKRCDTGESVAAAPIGRLHPYSRRGSGSSVVLSRSRRSSTSGSNAEVVGEIDGETDGLIENVVEAEEVATESEGDCEADSERHASPLGGSTDDGESVEDATPGDSLNTSTLSATATIGATVSSTLGAMATLSSTLGATTTLSSTLGATATLGATLGATATLGAALGATELLGTTLGASAVLGATSTIGSMSTLGATSTHGATSTLGATSSFDSTDWTVPCPSIITLQNDIIKEQRRELLEATKGICGRIDLSDDAALYPLRELASRGHSDSCLANGVNGIRLFTDRCGSIEHALGNIEFFGLRTNKFAIANNKPGTYFKLRTNPNDVVSRSNSATAGLQHASCGAIPASDHVRDDGSEPVWFRRIQVGIWGLRRTQFWKHWYGYGYGYGDGDGDGRRDVARQRL
ncbi:hypothetical protein BDK51DRAFT_41294 [Blyttiomyces helicus]|uniref:Uncharacterized protein n=1 Tax=Blyttiomyces helicus TaxID=388810 RepID=A0A4P9WC03_9FUNG|nr:hypothetical protein BDK51DRAFT_41294 [Blyttiomyces helicus]|eukprot:RKO89113.1 hypothetical protein BDK51DRAFT_41294 [Blyttiomyces helicus]